MIDGIPLADLAPATLLGIGILLLFTGRLATKRELDDVKAQRDRALDMLQERTERDETILEFLRAIKEAARARGGDPT